MSNTDRTSNERVSISAEGSELMMELFNRMPVEALKNVPEQIAKRIGDFMVANGYRIVFDRWYLQADPKGPERSADETNGRLWTQAEWALKNNQVDELEIELRRYKKALQTANGFLIMNNLEPVKLEYSSEEPTPRREYHANGTYWSGVPTVDMPCDFCTLPITDHDPRTHACPPEKASHE